MKRSRRYVRDIELRDLMRVILKKSWIMVICAVAAFAGTYAYVEKTTPISYTATASLYVSNNNPNSANFQYTSMNDLDSAMRLMETYMVVIRSKKVLDVVSERLGGRYSTTDIARSISLGSISNTEIMYIDVTTPIPQLSMDICNAVADAAPTEIIRVVNAGSAEVIDYAALPTAANDRKLTTYGMMAALMAAVLVCVAVFLRYIFDPHVFSAEDFAPQSSLPVLGNIPDDTRLSKSRRIDAGNHGRVNNEMSSHVINSKTSPVVAEAYRTLRGNLYFALSNTLNKAVVVTSATPGEGKSTVCCNLAILSARESNRVLLIDADTRRPRLAQYLGLDRDVPGLIEILEKELDFRKVVVENVRTGLDFLSAGNYAANATELVASHKVKRLLEELRDQYDLIIIDTPPVNVVNDSLDLAGKNTSMLMVVRAGYSRYDEIRMALSNIESYKLNMLGFVVTRDRMKINKRKSHYMRYYRSYYEPRESQHEPAAQAGDETAANTKRTHPNVHGGKS